MMRSLVLLVRPRMRNELIAEYADEILIAYAQPDGNLERLVLVSLRKGKRVLTFDVAENRALRELGAVGIEIERI